MVLIRSAQHDLLTGKRQALWDATSWETECWAEEEEEGSTVHTQSDPRTMNRRCAFLHISDPKQRCKLFDSLVLPVLDYASEVWAVDKKMGESAEQLHWQFLKFCTWY